MPPCNKNHRYLTISQIIFGKQKETDHVFKAPSVQLDDDGCMTSVSVRVCHESDITLNAEIILFGQNYTDS